MSEGRQNVSRPPAVIGFAIRPFLAVGASEDYYCGADARRVEFPTVRRPIWRGEVPAGAECARCGIPLGDLE